MPKSKPSFRTIPRAKLTFRYPKGSGPISVLTFSVQGPARFVGPTLALIEMARRGTLRVPNRPLLELSAGRSLSDTEYHQIRDFVLDIPLILAHESVFKVPMAVVRSTLSRISKLEGLEACLAYHLADHESRDRIDKSLIRSGQVRDYRELRSDPESATSEMPPAYGVQFQTWLLLGTPPDPKYFPPLVAEVLGRLRAHAAADALCSVLGSERGRPIDKVALAVCAECRRWWRLMKLGPAKIWHRADGHVSPLIFFTKVVLYAVYGRVFDSHRVQILLAKTKGRVFRYQRTRWVDSHNPDAQPEYRAQWGEMADL